MVGFGCSLGLVWLHKTLLNMERKQIKIDEMKKLLICLLSFAIFITSENAMSATKEFNVDNQIYKVLTLEEWEQAQTSGQ